MINIALCILVIFGTIEILMKVNPAKVWGHCLENRLFHPLDRDTQILLS